MWWKPWNRPSRGLYHGGSVDSTLHTYCGIPMHFISTCRKNESYRGEGRIFKPNHQFQSGSPNMERGTLASRTITKNHLALHFTSRWRKIDNYPGRRTTKSKPNLFSANTIVYILQRTIAKMVEEKFSAFSIDSAEMHILIQNEASFSTY